MKLTYFVLIFCLSLNFFVSCAPFQRPEYAGVVEYSPQNEFATPEELYKSNEILKTTDSEQEKETVFQLSWPVKTILLSRGFTNGARNAHLGLDLRGRKGTPILAAHPGTIIYVGSAFRGFGKMIIIEYDHTWASLYGHLSKFKVKMGDTVKAGQTIGLMGRTGKASGVHLHFELMNQKNPVDPIPLLPNSY